MPNPHNPARATMFALVHLSGGRCYWPVPPCPQRVTTFVGREPVNNLEIAHIRAAEPGGPRYDPDMTDEQRRAWPNLIFLCTPHHRYVDKTRPELYPRAVLERWKSEREARGYAQLKGLADLTEDRLERMLRSALAEAISDMRAGGIAPDQETARIIESAARQINSDVAETLHLASNSLTSVLSEDNVQTLWNAAQILQDITFQPDIDRLDEIVSDLRTAIDDLRGMRGWM